MKHIVKRKGHKEMFDERKIYASCYAASISSHLSKKEAEIICEKISKDIKAWIKTKKDVTSTQIFKQVIKLMKSYDKNAAFMYETHRDVS
ncbi:hypothetical protein HYX17_01365 [Candidatus Woesearchaeota archaeon]|nr:hypothetical protein [Candidatus Woesearchaeota archaeon]